MVKRSGKKARPKKPEPEVNEPEANEADLTDLAQVIKSFEERMKIPLEHLRRNRDTRQAILERDFIAEQAVESWTRDDGSGIVYCICDNLAYNEMILVRETVPGWNKRFAGVGHFGPWNGYAKFPKLPGASSGYGGIYTYVPVHGGITFFQEWADGSVTYGFDCAHFNSRGPQFQ